MPEAVQKFALCAFCIGRQGPDEEDFEEVEGSSCSLCGGLFDRIPSVADAALRKLRRYDFRNFSVGMSLPEGVQEKEDEIRSKMKLKGKETVKTQAARLFAERISSRVRRPIEKMKPDLTILAGMVDGSAMITTRPLLFYGRYSKPGRINQRRELCPHCSGSGCQKCGKTGYEKRPSVEGHLRRKLEAFTGTDRMTFTWIGSEDAESRVYPPGRPFVVELKNPVRRSVPKKFASRSGGGQVSVCRGRLLPSRPTRLPSFKFRTEITCSASVEVDPARLKDVKKRFRRTLVRFDRPHNRPASKMVYRATATKRGRNLIVDAVLDGGLPVKRFVSGELVTPSVSEVLKTEVRCSNFDICEVKETGKFSYAEITRV